MMIADFCLLCATHFDGPSDLSLPCRIPRGMSGHKRNSVYCRQPWNQTMT